MPASFWAQALATATHLLNLWTCQTTSIRTPFELLLGTPPSYDSLRVFGCLCYPNQASTIPHKLSAYSTLCVLLGYPADHRGYRCLNLRTRRVITSRHIVFDESQFPFQSSSLQPRTTTAGCATVTELDSPILIRQPAAHAPQLDAQHEQPAPSIAMPGTNHSSPSTVAPASPMLPEPTPSSGAAVIALLPHAPPAPNAPHPMITRDRAGVYKPNPRYALTSTAPAISPIPTSAHTALKDPHWHDAMALEFDALQRNWTWRLFDRPPGANVVSGKWVFKHKLNPDGTLERYKARGWCAVSPSASGWTSTRHLLQL